MTRRKHQRWLPALLMAPIAAGLFGATASWALANDPQPKQPAVAAQTSAPASSSTSGSIFGDAVPQDFSTSAEQNQVTIAELETKLSEARARLDALRTETAALQGAGGGTSGSGSSAQQQWAAPSQAAPSAPQPAPQVAPQPAPRTNSTTGAS